MKLGGKTRNATQKLALNVTGNPHVAVTAGFGAAAALDFVADPLNVVPAAKAPKYLMKAGKSALRAGQASKGAAGFSDAVAAAKNGSGIAERAVPNDGLTDKESEVFWGIAFKRRPDLDEDAIPITKKTALKRLEQYPHVVERFKKTFPFIKLDF